MKHDHRLVAFFSGFRLLTFSSIVTFCTMTAVQISDASAQAPKAASPPTAAVTFVPMSVEGVRSSVMQWLATAGADAATVSRATELWSDQKLGDGLSAEELLDRVVETLATADTATRRFLDACNSASKVESPVFDGIRADSFYQNSILLYQARWFAQHRFFDESLEILERLNPENVIDPAALFFYRAVCQQRLLQSEAARESLFLLLNNTVDVPERFRAVAGIMTRELDEQEAEGLEYIARLMSDVQRRLDLGRSDQKVQKQEDEVVALLDQLLEDMKNQQQQQQQSGGGQGGGSQQQQGQQGANQSQISGSKAEGIADRKELSEEGAWGMLDAQTEAKARELIRQKFPANYLDAIGRYTRKIAEQK